MKFQSVTESGNKEHPELEWSQVMQRESSDQRSAESALRSGRGRKNRTIF